MPLRARLLRSRLPFVVLGLAMLPLLVRPVRAQGTSSRRAAAKEIPKATRRVAPGGSESASGKYDRQLAAPRGVAWTLPDADLLVQRVYARIVSQDKPGAVPIPQYQRRFFGKDATLEAVRQFAGHSVDLPASAFAAVEGWTDAAKLSLPLCEGPGCPAPISSIWLAITRIERGELPHELHVWYTTNFAAESPGGPQRQAYAFCERWLRVAGSWKYDGFVRVKTMPTE